MGKDEKGEIHIGAGAHVIVKTSAIVQMKDELKLFIGPKGHVASLEIDIKANFDTIPEKYHQTFISMMTSRYGGVVNILTNTTPFIEPLKSTKRWFQFWKSKI